MCGACRGAITIPATDDLPFAGAYHPNDIQPCCATSEGKFMLTSCADDDVGQKICRCALADHLKRGAVARGIDVLIGPRCFDKRLNGVTKSRASSVRVRGHTA